MISKILFNLSLIPLYQRCLELLVNVLCLSLGWTKELLSYKVKLTRHMIIVARNFCRVALVDRWLGDNFSVGLTAILQHTFFPFVIYQKYIYTRRRHTLVGVLQRKNYNTHTLFFAVPPTKSSRPYGIILPKLPMNPGEIWDKAYMATPLMFVCRIQNEKLPIMWTGI